MIPREHSVFLCVPDVRAADDDGHGPDFQAGTGANHDPGVKKADHGADSSANHSADAKSVESRGLLTKSAAGTAPDPTPYPTSDSIPALLRREIRSRLPSAVMHSCAALPELHAALCRISPDAIVLDESALPEGDLEDLLAALAQSAPLVLIGSKHATMSGPDGVQSGLVPLIAAGRVDFVFRRGNFPVLAAALVERAVRAAEAVQASLESGLRNLPEEALEVLRHEINNPLTGILGNAEILLASRRLQLPPDSVQRLQTIVELAVRLRENVLRVSRDLPLARRAASR